jgi:plastocyanin domain-containing protein
MTDCSIEECDFIEQRWNQRHLVLLPTQKASQSSFVRKQPLPKISEASLPNYENSDSSSLDQVSGKSLGIVKNPIQIGKLSDELNEIVSDNANKNQCFGN